VVSTEFDAKFAPGSFDLVIDATADRTVRTLIERQRAARRDVWPASATLLIGHDAPRHRGHLLPRVQRRGTRRAEAAELDRPRRHHRRHD